jgi:calcineurin-like phosphoesterase
MQEKRHLADYDPFETFKKSVVVQDIATVKQTIIDFNAVPTKDRRAFCAFVVFKRR